MLRSSAIVHRYAVPCAAVEAAGRRLRHLHAAFERARTNHAAVERARTNHAAVERATNVRIGRQAAGPCAATLFATLIVLSLGPSTITHIPRCAALCAVVEAAHRRGAAVEQARTVRPIYLTVAVAKAARFQPAVTVHQARHSLETAKGCCCSTQYST